MHCEWSAAVWVQCAAVWVQCAAAWVQCAAVWVQCAAVWVQSAAVWVQSAAVWVQSAAVSFSSSFVSACGGNFHSSSPSDSLYQLLPACCLSAASCAEPSCTSGLLLTRPGLRSLAWQLSKIQTCRTSTQREVRLYLACNLSITLRCTCIEAIRKVEYERRSDSEARDKVSGR